MLFFMQSCSVSKPVSATKDAQIVKAGTTPPVKDKSEPKTDPVENQKKDDKAGTVKPSMEKNIKVTLPVDTIRWDDVSDKYPPVKVRQKQKVIFAEGLDLKDEYNIKLLIPLNSDAQTFPADSRFVHFYAGALRALETLDEEGIKLNVHVIDTEEGSYKVKDNLNDLLTDNIDLIIGPFEREDIRILAEECKLKSIPLVSPWQTSTKITNENPYYVQMKPNLKEHYLRLAQSTAADYQKGEVVIIGKNNKETTSWIQYFQETVAESLKISDFFGTYFVSSDSLNTGPTAFARMFKNTKIKAVIIPNYSYTDEDFIYSCLRRLSAEKSGRHISVYGMPILFESPKIDFDFYNALKMKVVMSDFVDIDQGKIREFRRAYLDMYGEIPSDDAVKGYDMMLYLGRNIWKYGRNFQYYLENEATSYLQSVYDIRKAKSEDSPVSNDPQKFDYFENKHLDIIEFIGNKWERKN
jgi:hypothetical protein